MSPPGTSKSNQESRILPRVREQLTKNQDQELESCKSRILETLTGRNNGLAGGVGIHARSEKARKTRQGELERQGCEFLKSGAVTREFL